MNKFKLIYQKIMNELKSVSDTKSQFINYDQLHDNYDVITQDTIYLINQYVKDPQITPAPKDFLNFICSKVKYKRDNITIISFKELYELLREYEYPFYEDFKRSLKSLNGNLYIVMLFDRDFEFIGDSSILNFNSTFSFLLHYIKDSNICQNLCKELLSPRMRNVDAFCSKTDNDLKNDNFFQNNCLIYVSLKTEFKKDSLEHQLTHFVQKTVGFQKTYDKIVNDKKYNDFENKNVQSAKKLINWIKNNITNDFEQVNKLMNFFAVKFASNELHESIKAVLNGFQRIYEFGKLSYINQLDYSKSDIDKAESKKDIQFRIQWIQKFLKIINSEKFIKDDLKVVILKLFQTNEQQEYMIKYRSYFLIMLYFGFKNMFSSLNIDQKIKDHFQTFKYKDN